jgi:hypothetical protein
MLEIYAIAAVAVLIAGLWGYAKIKSGQAAAAKQETKVYKQQAEVATITLEKKVEAEVAVQKVEKELNVKHVAEQAKIDAGARDDFDNTGF